MSVVPSPVPDLHYQTLAKLAVEHPLIGVALLRHRTIRGEPLSFVERPSLVELYDAVLKYDCDIVKAIQLGVTELEIQMAIYEAGWLGRIVAYCLPTQDLRNRFVNTRIDPILKDIPAYRTRLPGADLENLGSGEAGNRRTKRLGSGLILFLGAATDGDFVEFSADTLVIDEYDQCYAQSAENLAKANDRLREGKKPRTIRLGNPEVPRGGIERLVEEGDNREWTWRCTCCGERQTIDWLENVVMRDDNGAWRLRDEAAMVDPDAPVRPVCRKCKRPFERVANGAAWVPLHPGTGRKRSYRMTRWDSLRQGFRQLWVLWLEAQASTRLLRAWWRANAGRAWEPISGSITREALIEASVLPTIDHLGGDTYEGLEMISGTDVGSLFNITITELVKGPHGHAERQARWVGTVESPEQVLDLWERFHVRTAVVDAGPERRISARLRDEAAKFGCTVWLCDFHPGAKTSEEPFAMRLEWAANRVVVDRTQLLDASADALRLGAMLGRFMVNGEPVPDPGDDGARLWPQDTEYVLGWVAQMQASKRKIDGAKIVWDEGSQPDHYRLADSYDLLAMYLNSQGGSFF